MIEYDRNPEAALATVNEAGVTLLKYPGTDEFGNTVYLQIYSGVSEASAREVGERIFLAYDQLKVRL
jgi:hypothetical protein